MALLDNIMAAGGMIAQAVQAKKDRQQSVENQNRTIQANKEMAEYAYSKDLEMWNRQNEYNNPLNQMGRLKDAGINPVLAFGKDIGGNTSGQMPKYNAPTIKYDAKAPQILAVLEQFQNFKMRQAQTNLVQEQVHTQNELQDEKRLQNIVKGIKADWWSGIEAFTRKKGRTFVTEKQQRGKWLLDNQLQLHQELNRQAKERTNRMFEETQGARIRNQLNNMELELYDQLGTHGKGASMFLQLLRSILK